MVSDAEYYQAIRTADDNLSGLGRPEDLSLQKLGITLLVENPFEYFQKLYGEVIPEIVAAYDQALEPMRGYIEGRGLSVIKELSPENASKVASYLFMKHMPKNPNTAARTILSLRRGFESMGGIDLKYGN